MKFIYREDCGGMSSDENAVLVGTEKNCCECTVLKACGENDISW